IMVIVHLRPATQVMAGPSARIVTIKRETMVARPAPAPQRTRWQCSICGKLLSSKRSYDEHLNIHNQTRPFSCDHCDYAAASQMTLRRHILRNHTSRDDWHYKCAYCGETYMEPASYQQHVSSRHFGRSATFGCPYVSCTFQTKCSKHFKEHLTKVICCANFDLTHRMPEIVPLVGSSSSGSNSSSYAVSDDLQQYLVDDDLGVGFGRRSSSIARPIIRSNGEIESVIAAAAERAANVTTAEISSSFVPLHQIPSSVVSSVSSTTIPPQRRMVVLKKTERTSDEEVCSSNKDHQLHHPSTSSSSSSLPSSLRPPSTRDDVHQIRLADDDFMKAPIALRRSAVPPPLSRMTPRRVQLAPASRRVGTSMGPPSTCRASGRSLSSHHSSSSPRPSSPVTLGGARHAPAMISADAAEMIEHVEEISATNPMMYADGSVDYDVD
ncbi:hypothetical protein PFISCL1PPCAC_1920, partial [Pristionchus fissidentatus]